MFCCNNAQIMSTVVCLSIRLQKACYRVSFFAQCPLFTLKNAGTHLKI